MRMALVPVLNIGVGLLVLIIVWAATVLGIIALAAVPKARYAIPVVLVLSLAVTLVLLFYPRESLEEAVVIREAVDEVFYGRLALLLVLSLFLAGGGVIVFVLHCAEPITAGSLRRTYYLT